MFDFDASKLLIIGVVALVVIGPKDLPRVLRQVGQAVGKLRRMAGEFQGQFMDAMKEADLQDLRDEVTKLKDTASLDVDFNPVSDIKSELTKAVSAEPVAGTVPGLPNLEFGPAHHDSLTIPHGAGPAEAMAAAPDALALAEPAHHTSPDASGAVESVSSPGPDASDAVRRRRIVVPKRRPPGDRLGSGTPPAALSGRGRPHLPPRRDPRP